MNPTLDAALLKLLRNATRHLTARDICAFLYWSPTQLQDRILALRSAGYEFEEHPHLGIKLEHSPDRLIADDLFPANESARIGRQIIVFQETASTNDIAAKLGSDGGTDGLVIFAEKQTGGRGRLGRRWESESGSGIYFSLLLRPEFEQPRWINLTTWAAVAVARAIEKVVPCDVRIKWPNDIYLNGKKAVGILSEMHSDKDSHPFAIVGIGVNVNQIEFPESIASKATSLREISGEKMDRRQVAVGILGALEETYEMAGHSFSQIVEEADRRSFLKGRWIRLEAGTSVVEGIAGGLDSSGALQIQENGGRIISVSSGEVTVSSIAME